MTQERFLRSRIGRYFLAPLVGAAALIASVSAGAESQYPTKPVRIIVAFPPGQATDIIARLLAEELTKAWGQPVVVENRPGGDQVTGTMAGLNAPADGYTITFGTSSSFAVNPAINPKLPYDPKKDFTMVHGIFSVPWIIVAHPSAPYNTLAELVDAAKKDPGKIQWGYGATSLQLGAELFKLKSGAQISGVSYKGTTPANNDLLGGHIPLALSTVAATLPHIRTGKLKALATLSSKRVPLVPDVPTASEAGVPGMEAEGWGGLAVPKATPTEVVAKIGAEVTRIANDPAIQQRMLSFGIVPDPRGPKEWAAFVDAEVEKWTDIARQANVRTE